MTRHVIIGAGEAGTRAALGLKGKGSVTLIGEEPHRPYERPPLSKPGARGVTLKPIADIDALAHVDFRPGSAVIRIDREARVVHLDDGEGVPYDRLLLATGARPRGLTCPGSGHALALRRFEDAQAIFSRARSSRRAVIIGAGLIGLELAAVLRQTGLAVTILEAGPRAAVRALAPAIAERLVARHRAEGVAFRFDARISHLTPDAVHLADGDRVESDLIVAAIGVTPNTALAEAAGLPCANGILVGPSLQTPDPDIFAAGDCACVDHPHFGPTRFEAWRTAIEMGASAGEAMTGAAVEFAPVPWFWSDQYDLGLQMAGFHDPSHRSVERASSDATVCFELDEAGRLKAAAGLGAGNSGSRDIKLAERMIFSGARPDPLLLADSDFPLKKLLHAGRAPSRLSSLS